MVCFGSRWERSSLKTLLCLAYSGGIFASFVPWAVPIVALQSSMRLIGLGLGLFIVRGVNRALAASAVLNTMGSCVWSIQPLLQSILGCTTANQGYPKIALCSPSCVRKNLMLVLIGPVRMARSV